MENKYCPKCGSKQEGNAFCSNCGNQLLFKKEARIVNDLEQAAKKAKDTVKSIIDNKDLEQAAKKAKDTVKSIIDNKDLEQAAKNKHSSKNFFNDITTDFNHLIISIIICLPSAIFLENNDGLDVIDDLPSALVQWIVFVIVAFVLALFFWGFSYLLGFKKHPLIKTLYISCYIMALLPFVLYFWGFIFGRLGIF